MDLRIYNHPILEFKRDREVYFYFNGKKIKGYSGETIAAALYASGYRRITKSPKYRRPRGVYCMIGKCSSCMVRLNGVPNVRSCIVPVENGMIVETQEGYGELPSSVNLENSEDWEEMETDVAVVGGGPAGLSAAIYAARVGANVLLMDENYRLGGQLIKQTHKFFGSKDLYSGIRGIEIARILEDEVRSLPNIEVMLGAEVFGFYEGRILGVLRDNKVVKVKAKTIVFATGASENFLVFENNDLPGVMGAGAAQTLMNVYGIKPGNSVLMVGAGNVGLIVSYQMLQAGIEVKAIVEAMPRIGGYVVHAAKVRRYGVPILTSHTIKRALGRDHVEGATIVKLDENWNEIPGSERDIEVDTICLAVGLNPSSQLLFQAGCEMRYIPELGGEVALRDENLETTVEGVFVAGDLSGIEEASTAILEGRIAGISAAMKVVGVSSEWIKKREEMKAMLKEIRSGPFSAKVVRGLRKALIGVVS